MNDYRKLANYLDGLDDDAFIEFCGRVPWHVPELGDETIRSNSGGIKVLAHDTWRANAITRMLDCKHQNPTDWERLCVAATIETDAGESLAIAWAAEKRSKDALWVAFGSFFVSLLAMLSHLLLT
jgi:hypothetical protein